MNTELRQASKTLTKLFLKFDLPIEPARFVSNSKFVYELEHNLDPPTWNYLMKRMGFTRKNSVWIVPGIEDVTIELVPSGDLIVVQATEKESADYQSVPLNPVGLVGPKSADANDVGPIVVSRLKATSRIKQLGK